MDGEWLTNVGRSAKGLPSPGAAAGARLALGSATPAVAALLAGSLLVVGAAIGGGLWLRRQEADRREELARNEGREWQAVEATLEKSAKLQQQGRWSEIRAALEGTQSLLGTSAPSRLRERVRQARTDADMVAELEEIRVRLSTGGTGLEPIQLSPEKMYAEAFRKYGIDLLVLEPAEAEAIIRNSAIRETLLAYMHDWLYWMSDVDRDRVRAVVEKADDNDWRRAFRSAIADTDQMKLKELAAASEAAAQPPVVLSGLGGSLLWNNQREEGAGIVERGPKASPRRFLDQLSARSFLGSWHHNRPLATFEWQLPYGRTVSRPMPCWAEPCITRGMTTGHHRPPESHCTEFVFRHLQRSSNAVSTKRRAGGTRRLGEIPGTQSTK